MIQSQAASAALAFDLLPVGVMAFNREMRVQAWSATLTKWSKLSADEMIGGSLLERFPDLQRPALQQRLTAVFDRRQAIVLSSALHGCFLPIYRRNGRLMPQRTHIRPLPGRSDLALAVIEDQSHLMDQVEQLRRARSAAQEANRAKSDFLANMTHELRTPLSAILGYAGLMLNAHDPELLRDAAETIHRNGAHLLALVNDVLDLSKIEAGQVRIEKGPCSPTGLVREVVTLLRLKAESKGLTITGRCDSSLPQVFRTDGNRLRQVLLNLVCNAVKYTDRGTVKLTADYESLGSRPQIIFQVTDTGIGMLPEDVDSLFSPRQRTRPMNTKRSGGAGLGLQICNKLVSLLGGKIRVESKPGVGTAITVIVPAEGGEAVVPLGLGASLGGRSQQSLRGRRVLVVDDCDDNRRMVAQILRIEGASVETAEDGAEALEAVFRQGADFPHGTEPGENRNAFDTVVIDLQLPVLDGYSAIEGLRSRGFGGLIVGLTAYTMDGDRERVLASGADAYLSKPFQAHDLVATLERPRTPGLDAPLADSAH